MKHKIIPIFIPHEGCPHDCSFCNQKKIAGTVVLPDEEAIWKTIRRYRTTNSEFRSDYTLAYYGGSFTAIDEERQIRLLTLAKKAKEEGEIQGIRISTRPDYLTQLHVKRLKDHGVDYVEIGIQSTDPEVLALAGRQYDVGTVKQAVALLRQAGIGYGYQIMVGLPGDDAGKLYATCRDLLEVAPASIRIYPCLVLADTLLENWYREGSYRPLEIWEAVELAKIPYVLFTNREIPIIRMGLHASESLQNPDAFIAGPFHPAFGEMVVSSIYKDLLETFIMDMEVKEDTIVIGGDQRFHSKIVGNKAFVFQQLLTERKVRFQWKSVPGLGADVELDWNGQKFRLGMKTHLENMEAFYERKFNTRK